MAWKLIDSDGNWTKNKHRAVYMISSAADIESPPEEDSQLDAGSIAYTADLTSIYQKDAADQWVKVGGS